MKHLPYTLFALFTLIVSGCATHGGEVLKIDTRQVLGLQNMPNELTLMLSGLGYRWIPIIDPETDRPVKMVQTAEHYKMQFKFIESQQLRVDARIKIRGGDTRLHVYETGSQTLSPASMALFEQLRERTGEKFGRANVSH